jgi:hypothetical protein
LPSASKGATISVISSDWTFPFPLPALVVVEEVIEAGMGAEVDDDDEDGLCFDGDEAAALDCAPEDDSDEDD